MPGEPALSIELVWEGKPSSYQLSLTFPGDLDAQLVGGILQELQTDGLRDYLVLHRMAAEQSRTGSIRWTWREHRERTAYDRRPADSAPMAEAAAAVSIHTRIDNAVASAGAGRGRRDRGALFEQGGEQRRVVVEELERDFVSGARHGRPEGTTGRRRCRPQL